MKAYILFLVWIYIFYKTIFYKTFTEPRFKNNFQLEDIYNTSQLFKIINHLNILLYYPFFGLNLYCRQKGQYKYYIQKSN